VRIHLTLVLIAIVVLALAPPLLSGSSTDPETMINHARSVILGKDASRDAMLDALVEILDATLLVLPETGYAAEFRSRIEAVRKLLGDGALFSDKVRQYLALAYKLVTGGKAWQLPQELRGPYREADIMEQARKVGGRLIDSALAERRAGRSEQSVRHLLEIVLMVITPVEA